MSETPLLEEFTELHRRFADALFNKRPEALPALFTADTILLPSGKPLVSGRDNVVAFWTGAINSMEKPMRSRFEAVDSLFKGDVVVECGQVAISAVEGGREEPVDNGKYLIVWKREDGQWKIHRDIFNSNTRR